MSLKIDDFVCASSLIFRVSSPLVSTTINTNLLCCSTEISRQECNWRHPSGFLLFHLLRTFSCESVLRYQKFSMPHINCFLLQNRFDLSLFNEQDDIKKTWFCVKCLYCSLFSPRRQADVDGLLTEVVQTPSLLVFRMRLSTAPHNLG